MNSTASKVIVLVRPAIERSLSTCADAAICERSNPVVGDGHAAGDSGPGT